MKVILLEDVKSLGKKGDVVDVNDGYARNFVLPKKLGIEANNKNMNDLKLKKANDEKLAQEQLKAAQDFAKAMEEDEVVLSMKAGEGGRTFGSISTKEIAQGYKVKQVTIRPAGMLNKYTAKFTIINRKPRYKEVCMYLFSLPFNLILLLNGAILPNTPFVVRCN